MLFLIQPLVYFLHNFLLESKFVICLGHLFYYFSKLCLELPILEHQIFLHKECLFIYWIISLMFPNFNKAFIFQNCPHFRNCSFMRLISSSDKAIIANITLLKEKFKPVRVLSAKVKWLHLICDSSFLNLESVLICTNGKESGLVLQLMKPWSTITQHCCEQMSNMRICIHIEYRWENYVVILWYSWERTTWYIFKHCED